MGGIRKMEGLQKCDEKVRKSIIIKTFWVTEKIRISLREDEMTLYKLRKKRGEGKPVYTFTMKEWLQVLPVLQKLIDKYA